MVAAGFCQPRLLAQNASAPQYHEQPPFDLKSALGTAGDWKAVVTAALEPQGEIVTDDGPSQSRICFSRTAPAKNECSYFQDLFHSKRAFQVLYSLAVVALQSGSGATNGLQLKAAAWYSTGQVQETAIWVYDAQRDDWRQATAFESPEVRIFSSGLLNGVLVTSDWQREEGDTRWSDHERRITVYRYFAEAENRGYRKLLEYTTATKYGAEDTATIDAELSTIEAKLP